MYSLDKAGLLMGDDIGSGSVCFDFCSTNVVQLSNWKYVVYRGLTTIEDTMSLDLNQCHNPLITYQLFFDAFEMVKKLFWTK